MTTAILVAIAVMWLPVALLFLLRKLCFCRVVDNFVKESKYER